MVEMNYTHGQVEVFRDDMLWCLPVSRTVAEHITDATGGTGQDGPQEHRILPAALGMLLTHRCSYTSEAQRSRNKGKEGSVYTSMNMHAPSQSTVLYRKESGSRISEAVFPRKRHAGQVSMCYPVRKRTWARAENGHAQQREMDTLHCRKLKMDIPT